jgi:hypothetical protein
MVRVRNGAQTWQDANSPGAPSVRSYWLLEGFAGPASIEGREKVGGALCTVVRLGGDGPRTRRLWIDPATYFVRKDEASERSPDGISQVTVTYTVAATGVQMAPGLFAIGLAEPPAAHAGLAFIARPAPAFTLRDDAGGAFRLADLKGKVVMLVFWADPCPAFTGVLVELAHMEAELRTEDMALLGVCREKPGCKQVSALRWLQDPGGEAGGRYRVERFPPVVVISRDGRIVYYENEKMDVRSLRETLVRQGVRRKAAR